MRAAKVFCVLSLLAVVSAAAPRAAHAQTTALFLDSEAGDPVGGGRLWSYTTVNATFSTLAADAYGTSISIAGTGFSSRSWGFHFRAPGAHRSPVAGVYEEARRAPFTDFVGLDAGGCNELTGRFVVLEAVYDSNGSVIRFAADFEQHCNDADPALFGAVRYNSTVSTLVPFDGAYPIRRLIMTPPAHGSVQGTGLNCGSSGAQCVVTLPAPATVPILAVPDPGFVFAGWTGGCTGGPRGSVHLNMQRTCAAAFTPFVPASPRTLAVITGVADPPYLRLPIVVSAATSTWSIRPPFSSGVNLRVDFVGATHQGSVLFFIEPPTGQTFEIGREYEAGSIADATHAWLSISPDGTSCSGGTFTVRDWAVDSDGVATRFSIDFQQSCGGGLYGTLQYASTYAYGRLDVTNTALHFTGVRDQFGIVSHSADQVFQVTPADLPAVTWDVKSDQAWLTATPLSGTTSTTIAARVRTGAAVAAGTSAIGHLQVLARGIINVPDPVTVTLDLASLDTTVRPFALFRPASGGWLMPNQGALQFGLPGDIPLSGDFDGDGTPDIAVYRPGTGQWFAQGQATRQWGSPGDIPVPADYNGDGMTDIAVFRQNGSFAQWFIFGETAPRAWGLRGDVPVPGDYDGDGVADVAVFRPATGTWLVVRSSTGQMVTTVFGLAGDIPLVADFDGNRKVDPAVFRPSTGFWYITTFGGGTDSVQFGQPGDIPVPLDVTGDGRVEIRLWRPSTGTWPTLNLSNFQSWNQQYGQPGDVPVMARPMLVGSRPADLDGDLRADVTIYRPSSGEWFTRQSATGYSSFTIQPLGVAGDVPVPGDYDGDRRANPAVYHPSTRQWIVRRFDGTTLLRTWGVTDDVPVPADYDGDGRTDMAVYRPSSGQWFILTSASDYAAAVVASWGLPGDIPVPADFDGDGRADAAVYRPSTGEWFVAPSSGGWFVRQWGLTGDVPIARDFDGDGRADLAVFRPATGEWFVLDAASGVLVFTRQWGLDGDVPVADDYDGDGAADVAVYRPSTGDWFVIRSSDGSVLHLQWGLAGDVPVTRR